jgi:hypothetical protein
VRLVAILVTVSLNLAEPLSLRELRLFVETAERNRADVDTDLREYDENNELVGLAAVGQAEAVDEADEDDEDVEDDESAGSDDEDVDATQGAESDADEGDTDGAYRP